MSTAPVSIPSITSLYYIDRTFARGARTSVFSLIVAAGIKWASQPVPSVVKVENSPVEIWVLQWGPMVAVAVAALALIVAVRRYLWVKNVLGHGVAIKGTIDEVDVYEREANSSDTTPAFQRAKIRTYYAVVRYTWQGVDQQVRLWLPYSPSTYQLSEGREVDLIVHESAPKKPLIRTVYLNQIGVRRRWLF